MKESEELSQDVTLLVFNQLKKKKKNLPQVTANSQKIQMTFIQISHWRSGLSRQVTPPPRCCDHHRGTVKQNCFSETFQTFSRGAFVPQHNVAGRWFRASAPPRDKTVRRPLKRWCQTQRWPATESLILLIIRISQGHEWPDYIPTLLFYRYSVQLLSLLSASTSRSTMFYLVLHVY